jgi:phage terminase large subunit
VDLIVSTFRDNRYLTDSIVEELLWLRKSDPELWNVYGNWHYGRITWAIFTKGEHWDVIEDLPTDKDWNLECKKKWYWQDFWFSNDPTTVVGIYEYWKDTIILDEVFWKTNLINTYQDDSNKQASITWQYEMHWIEKHEKIVADSSEPKSIEEIYHAWYNIHPVKKGPGSVVSWIKMMKKFKILITARSVNLIKEFSKYVWATDKYWKPLRDREWRPIPLDKFNHGIDASSYGIRTFFEGQQEFFTWFF